MPLLYWKGSRGLRSGLNFGDLLNRDLLEPLLDAGRLAATDVLGIGTILDNRFLGDRQNVVVMGSGIGHGALPPGLASFEPLLVRGPHTALALGDPGLPQGDPGFLAERPEGVSSAGGILVPHYSTFKRVSARSLAKNTGLRVLDIRQAPEPFLQGLATARYAYVEAMHGAIAAEALRIPWAPVQLGAQEPWIKWMDALGPLGRSYTQPARKRPGWARKDVELHLRQYLLSRFPGGCQGEGTGLASDARLQRVRRDIRGAIDRFNAGAAG